MTVAFFEQKTLHQESLQLKPQTVVSHRRCGTAGRPPGLCPWRLGLPVGFSRRPWSTMLSNHIPGRCCLFPVDDVGLPAVPRLRQLTTLCGYNCSDS